MSFVGRFGTGLGWVGGLTGALRLLTLAKTIVLARLLTPADFGTYAMAALAIGLLTSFTGLGIREGVIQSRHDTRPTLDSAFALGIVRGVLFYGIAWLIAPFVAWFFELDELRPMIRVAALAPLVGSLSNPGPILYTKELDYRRGAWVAFLPPVLEAVLSVAFAIWTRSAWAFVYGQVVGRILFVPLSYALHPYRPRLRLAPAATRHLLRYAVHIVGSAPLFRLATQLDDIVVGRLFGQGTLGAYHVAFNLAALPSTYVAEVVSSVLFPVLTRLDNVASIRRAYEKTLRHVSALCFPASAFLGIFADELVRIVYGPHWAGAGPLVTAFALYGAMRSIGTLRMQLYKAMGRVELVSHLAVLNLGLTAFLLLAVGRYGPLWIALLLSLFAVPMTFYGFELVRRLLGLDLSGSIAACRPAATATALAAAAALGVEAGLPETEYLRFLAAAAVFGATYFAALTVLDRQWIRELRHVLTEARATHTERAITGL